jgi:hypothetical protein
MSTFYPQNRTCAGQREKSPTLQLTTWNYLPVASCERIISLARGVMKARLFGLMLLAALFGLSPANATTYTYDINAFNGVGLIGSITGSFTMDLGSPTSISNIDINASLLMAVLGTSGFQLVT